MSGHGGASVADGVSGGQNVVVGQRREEGCNGVEKGRDIAFVVVRLPCFGRIPFPSAPERDDKHDCYDVGLGLRLWLLCGE